MQQAKCEVRYLKVFEGKLILCRETSIPMNATLTKQISHNSKTFFTSDKVSENLFWKVKELMIMYL